MNAEIKRTNHICRKMKYTFCFPLLQLPYFRFSGKNKVIKCHELKRTLNLFPFRFSLSKKNNQEPKNSNK